jgi:uncharacterized lipoprotein YajG
VLLSIPSGADADAISDWFRRKMAKRPNAKVTIDQQECRFKDGELQRFLDSKIDVEIE